MKIQEFIYLSQFLSTQIDAIIASEDTMENKALGLGNLFATESGRFVILRTFTDNYYHGLLEIITKLSSKKEQKEQLQKLLKKTDGLDIGSLLIQTIQRFPKYDLFLNEFQKLMTSKQLAANIKLIKKTLKACTESSTMFNQKTILWLATQSPKMHLTPQDIKAIESLLKRLESVESESSAQRLASEAGRITALKDEISTKALALVDLAQAQSKAKPSMRRAVSEQAIRAMPPSLRRINSAPSQASDPIAQIIEIGQKIAQAEQVRPVPELTHPTISTPLIFTKLDDLRPTMTAAPLMTSGQPLPPPRIP